MTTVANAAPGSAGRRAPAGTTEATRASDDPDLRLARDPKAGAGRLMVLAGNRPDLRGVIVDNPGCSPELRTWVGRMSATASRPDDADPARADAADADDGSGDSLSLAPTGWEPSDIGLGDDPFGSVLGDPLMGSPLFDDGGLGEEPDDADAADAASGADSDGEAARAGRGQQRQQPSNRRTAAPRTAPAHTASARTASRTAAPRTSPSRTSSPRTTAQPPRSAQAMPTTVPAPQASAPPPPGRHAQPSYWGTGPGAPARPPAPGYGAPRRDPYAVDPQNAPWAPSGLSRYGGPQPTVPPGPPASPYGAGRYGAPPRPGPTPPSGVSTSSLKVVGGVIVFIIFLLLRILTG